MGKKSKKITRTQAEDAVRTLLAYVGEDTNREGLLDTPKRYVKALEEYTSGYSMRASDVMKAFKDGGELYNEMILVRDIPVYSLCEHHMAPFFGVAHIAYIPNRSILGLSKFARVADIFARRLQVQERLTDQIADALHRELQPQGVGVVIKCRHMCMESRGVRKIGCATTTSSLRGVFRSQPEVRTEFLSLANNGGH